MPTFADALSAVTAMLAAELGCERDDLTAGDVRVFATPAAESRPRLVRRYWGKEPSFTVISLGRGAVVSASSRLFDTVASLFRGTNRDQVFEPGRIATVEHSLRPFGFQVYGPYPRLVCGSDTLRRREPPDGIAVRVEATPRADHVQALSPERWPHAISPRRAAPPAVLATAWDGADAVGVASADADAVGVWQMGIDVAASERGRGIGAALTWALARHVLDAGDALFYGAAPTNIPSINTALAAGFRLAWLEIFTAPAGRW